MSYRSAAYTLYNAARRRVAPRLVYSQQLYEEALARYVSEETCWLDLGCGHQVLPAWRETRERGLVDGARLVVGIDADAPSLRQHRTIRHLAQGDIGALPFPPGTFDLVTLNMVVEHLDRPDAQFTEVERVLRPGGTLLLHTPNALGYLTLINRLVPHGASRRLARVFDGRGAGDVFPAYYRANSPRRLRGLAARTGLAVDTARLVTSSAAFVVIPPLMLLELLWIRLTMTKPLRALRTNLIAVLRKPGPPLRTSRAA